MKFRTLISLFLLAVLQTEQAEDWWWWPLVETKYGKLQGVNVPVKDTLKTVDAFFGVPFAKPPVGPLRLKNPEATEPWNSTRDATQFPPMCLQIREINSGVAQLYKSSFEFPPVSEDCLYLNVFTPRDWRKGLKLPVMVYMHGGGLVAGGASMYDGSAISACEDVVVVVIQYRLGIMGFFSTTKGKLCGNFGFMDQVAALRWVQENIADFGGDPQYVTIFGESAGAISVAAHVLSPLSKGLFHRAVSGSGAVLMSGIVADKPEDLTTYRKRVSDLCGCEPSSVVECLMGKSEEEILAIVEKMGFYSQSVSVDGVFFPKPPVEILDNNESHAVPFMLGYCNHDFSWVAPKALNVEGLTEGMTRESIHRELLKLDLLGFSSNDVPPVLDEYLAGAIKPLEFRDRFLEIGLDKLFAMPLLRTAKYHRDSGNPVYFYEFHHRSSLLADSRPDFVEADHGDDLIYVFGGPFLRDGLLFAGKATDEEKLLARIIMRYWGNFARNGDPNGPGLTRWPLFNENDRYLKLAEKPEAFDRLKEGRYKFWTQILPESTKRGDHTEL